MTTLICDCNGTMPLDRRAIAAALGAEAARGVDVACSTLCRRDAGTFQLAIKSDDDVLVACTQESRLFVELAAEAQQRTEEAGWVARTRAPRMPLG